MLCLGIACQSCSLAPSLFNLAIMAGSASKPAGVNPARWLPLSSTAGPQARRLLPGVVSILLAGSLSLQRLGDPLGAVVWNAGVNPARWLPLSSTIAI